MKGNKIRPPGKKAPFLMITCLCMMMTLCTPLYLLKITIFLSIFNEASHNINNQHHLVYSVWGIKISHLSNINTIIKILSRRGYSVIIRLYKAINANECNKNNSSWCMMMITVMKNHRQIASRFIFNVHIQPMFSEFVMWYHNFTY